MKKGIYRHFKGKEYELIDIATDSETEKEYVVYRALYGKRRLWIKPKEMFFEEIDRPEIGYTGHRFVYVREK